MAAEGLTTDDYRRAHRAAGKAERSYLAIFWLVLFAVFAVVLLGTIWGAAADALGAASDALNASVSEAP